MRHALAVTLCLSLLGATAVITGCSNNPNTNAAAVVAGGVVAAAVIDNIATWIRPVADAPPVDKSHSKVQFTNETDRAVSINLDGPRTYEVSVGHSGDIDLTVVPGKYTSRITGPSLRTTFKDYTFEGGTTYEYHVKIEGRHKPR